MIEEGFLDWVVGDELVVVDVMPNLGWLKFSSFWKIKTVYPVPGEIYKIRKFQDNGGGLEVLLEGFQGPMFEGRELGYAPRHFRKVVRRKQEKKTETKEPVG